MPRGKKTTKQPEQQKQQRRDEQQIQIVTQDILTNAKLDTMLRDLIEVKNNLKLLLKYAKDETDEDVEEEDVEEEDVEEVDDEED